MAESFRSGLESVSQTQQEIGLAIGLTPLQVFRYVVLPQATAVALPSFSANVIFLIKETSVFSAVALADLMYVAKDLIGLYYETDIASCYVGSCLSNHAATHLTGLLAG